MLKKYIAKAKNSTDKYIKKNTHQCIIFVAALSLTTLSLLLILASIIAKEIDINVLSTLGNIAPIFTAIFAGLGLIIAKKNLKYKQDEHEASQLVLYYDQQIHKSAAIFILRNNAEYPYFIDNISMNEEEIFKNTDITVRIERDGRSDKKEPKTVIETVWHKKSKEIGNFEIDVTKATSVPYLSDGTTIFPNLEYRITISAKEQEIGALIFEKINVKARPCYLPPKKSSPLKFFIPERTKNRH